MSRIHEALKKAHEERHSSQGADTVTLSVETPRTQVIAGIGLRAPAAETRARTETVPAPPGSAPELRFDSLLAHCSRREWHTEPGKNVFSNPAATACGAEQFRTLRSHLYQIRGTQPNSTLVRRSTLAVERTSFKT